MRIPDESSRLLAGARAKLDGGEMTVKQRLARAYAELTHPTKALDTAEIREVARDLLHHVESDIIYGRQPDDSNESELAFAERLLGVVK